MIIQQKVIFFENTFDSSVSRSYFNNSADVLTLSVDGDFSNGLFFIEGRNHGDWVTLAAINLSDLSIQVNGITKTGLYEVGVLSVRELRCRIEQIQGSVTIAGELISSGEV